jgi:hypothetical protein
MLRRLMRILRIVRIPTGEVARAVDRARLLSHLALACARRSTEPGDAWDIAARTHRLRRDAHMWEARVLANRPRKPIITFRGIPIHYDRRIA